MLRYPNPPARPIAFANESEFNIQSHRPNGDLIVMVNGAGHRGAKNVADSVPAFKVLNDAIETLMNNVLRIVDEIHPNHVQEKIKKAVNDALPQLYKAAQKAGLKYREENETNKAKFESVPPVVDTSVEQAYRDEFRPAEHGKKLEMLQDWPIEGVIAVARLGRHTFGLNADEWDRFVMSRLRAHNLTSAPAVQTSHTIKPSLESPLARGVDHGAVAQYVADGIAAWKLRDAIVEQAEHELQTICQVVAVLTGERIESVYEMLAGKTE